MSIVYAAALDRAAEIIALALGLERVGRAPIAQEPDEDELSGADLVATLSAGQSTETGYCLGAERPFEFEHRAAFECLAVKGDAAARTARVNAALELAAAAIAADPSLGGLVDYAELESADPTEALQFAALAGVLTLTYTAPTALG